MTARPALYIVKPAPPKVIEERPCPVCDRQTNGDGWYCDRCGVRMHEPCFWGRVATLEEWHAYLRGWIEAPECPDASPSCLCSACRQLDGRGKGEA